MRNFAKNLKHLNQTKIFCLTNMLDALHKCNFRYPEKNVLFQFQRILDMLCFIFPLLASLDTKLFIYIRNQYCLVLIYGQPFIKLLERLSFFIKFQNYIRIQNQNNEKEYHFSLLLERRFRFESIIIFFYRHWQILWKKCEFLFYTVP